MKVDVVVAYYQQKDLWPFVAWGLRRNVEHINRVFLVNDEPWDWTPTLSGVPLTLLDHPHDGFGMTRSYNQGARASETSHILLSQGDLVLEPSFLKKTLETMKARSLIYPWVYYIEIPRNVSGLEQPIPLWGDWRAAPGVIQERISKRRIFSLGKGACLLVEREKYLALGGFDEAYAPLGPNCEDHDFAVRWLIEYGQENFCLGGGAAWHLGDSPKERNKVYVARMPSYESRARLAATLGRYFQHRYLLWGTTTERPPEFDLTRLCVGHVGDKGCDIRVDCLRLDWMPDASAQSIQEFLPTTYLPHDQIVEHLKAVQRKLAPGGELVLSFVNRIPWTKKRLLFWMEILDLEVEEADDEEIVARARGGDEG